MTSPSGLSETTIEPAEAKQPAQQPENSKWGPAALDARRELTRQHLASVADVREKWINRNPYHYGMVSRLLRFLVEPGKRVLSIRSGPGQQLAEVRPAYGVGIDIAGEMVQVAKKRHPEFKFVVGFPDTNDFRELLSGEEPFDYILVNGIDDTVDVQSAFANLRALAKRETRVLIVWYNHLWEPMVILAGKFGLKVPTVNQNWLSEIDVANFLTISDYEALKTYRIVLLPKYIPLLSEFLNGFCARLPGLNRLCMVQVIVARVLPEPIKPKSSKYP